MITPLNEQAYSMVKDQAGTPEDLSIANDLFQKLSEEAKLVLVLIFNTPSECFDLFYTASGKFRKGSFNKTFIKLLQCRMGRQRRMDFRRKYPTTKEVFNRIHDELAEFVKEM
jgi:hypothetical protein